MLHLDIAELRSEKKLQEVLYSFSKTLSIAIIVIACAVLYGWAFNVDVLKRPFPHLVAMNPMTAVAFVISGTLGLLSTATSNLKEKRLLSFVLLSLLGLISVLKLSDTLFHPGINIDRLLFTATLKIDETGNVSNSMAANTAFNFLLASASFYLLSFSANSKKFAAHVLAILIALIAMLSILGYLYQVSTFYSKLAYMPMSFHTAISFLLLSLTLLFCSCDSGMMKHLTSSFAGSLQARILLVASVVVPFLLGFVTLLFFWNRSISIELVVASLVLSIMIVFFILVWHTTTLLNKKDGLQQKVQAELIVRTEELAASNDRLNLMNRQLEEFNFIASHDLQEPLRKVGIFCNMLYTRNAQQMDDSSLVLINKMQSATQRMALLIDNLLSYSRIVHAEAAYLPLNGNIIISEIISDLEIVIQEKKAVIEVAQLKPLYGDAIQIRQLFQNLISNSLKFTSEGVPPVINVISEIINRDVAAGMFALKEDGQSRYQVITVTDNGIGFETEYHEEIFAPFKRLNGISEYPGSGIGLSIVKKIIENQNGYIFATSKLGNGSIFKMLFPLVAGD